ncbi:hypothetical protein E1285_09920 [Actinomadura sp. 7K507]|nr:hypothetical protein E1285_09920 [Actinomadura sp. 7K507]
MLGVGGQRNNLSRRALRGGRPQGSGNGSDPAAEKRELLQRMRERNERRAASESDTGSEE